MNSFYGGRQGASFVIVKRFDGIDIPLDTTSPTYRFKEYAYDKDYNNGTGGFIVLDGGLIEKDEKSYLVFDEWKAHKLDGESVTYKGQTATFPIELAEGMIQCFSQGGVTTDVVNYGEYVIIDTLDKNSPENGKIFRRGLNYDYNAATNPYAGGEYIGQIVGPRGDSPEVYVDDFSDIVAEGGPAELKYNMSNGGVISGIETLKINKDEATGEETVDENGSVFNDSIKYTWVNIKDEFGSVTGCKIGFVFPHLSLIVTGKSVDPYYNRSHSTSANFENVNLAKRIDSGKHPYYAQWHISIPKGIKGDMSTGLKVVNGYAKSGAAYYSNVACTNKVGNLNSEVQVNFSNYKDSHTTSMPITDPNNSSVTRYVKNADIHRKVLIYKETNFDRVATGDYEYIFIGDYNMIEEVSLSEDGILTVSYNHDDAKELEHPIRWIDEMQVSDNGTLKVVYNTKTNNVQDTDVFNQILTWINSITLDNDGNFAIKYNNDKPDFNAVIKWVENITFNDNGNFALTFNTDKNNVPSLTKNIKWVKNVTFEDDGDFELTFNNGDAAVTKNIKWVNDVTLDDKGNFKLTFNNNDNPVIKVIKWVDNVTFDDNGNFKMTFNNGAAPITQVVRWIDNISLDTTTGKFTVNYNDGSTPYISNVIPWVNKVTLNNNGTFTVYYKDGTSQTQSEKLKWINSAKVENGQLVFSYNTSDEAFRSGKILKGISNVEILTKDSTGLEGSGTQKVKVTYNTNTNGVADSEIVGNPLNYIMEAVVTETITDSSKSNVLGSHLLILYSDPAYRAQLKAAGKCVKYPSTKFNAVRDDWYDMGDVRGAAGGLHIISTLTRAEATATLTPGNPPETITGNPEYAGWFYVIDEDPKILCYYDYIKQEWIEFGAIGENLVDPSAIITQSITLDDIDRLNPRGIVFLKEEQYVLYGN